MAASDSAAAGRRPAIPLLSVGELLEVLDPHERHGVMSQTLVSAQLPLDALDDPRDYLGVDSVWRLFSAQIAATGDELLGLGDCAHPAGLTEIVVARSLHEESLVAAMRTFCEVTNLLQSDLRLSFKHQRGEFSLNAVFPQQMDRRHQIYLEIACMPWHCTFCWMQGGILPLNRFATHPARATAATQLLSIFGCPVEYRQNGITLVYPESIAGTVFEPPPLSSWRQGIYTALCEQMRGRQELVTNDDIATYTETAVRNGITSQWAIAASAAMSVATLRRHLRRHNTSFMAIRDKVLRECAPQLLQAGYTTEDMAVQLGYSDARSFRRAFRRVLGHSPTQYRSFTHPAG